METAGPDRPASEPRYELLEGEQWRGGYATRRAAMADAERLAAKRGQTVHWARLSEAAVVGIPQPARGHAAFTVRVRASAPRRPNDPDGRAGPAD
jgi:hypothetical protein